MRRLAAYLAALAVLAALLSAAPASARPELPRMTTPRVIDASQELGEINYAEAILLKAYSVYAPDRLPEAYRGGIVEKCGYPTVREIEDALPILPADVADEIRDLRDRPSNMTYIDTEHFRIHYDTSGTHKIYNWPDTTYRDAVMAAAELSWAVEVDTMGFRQPPDDGSDPDGGDGSGLYDIYVQDLGTSYYGYTGTGWTQPGAPLYDCSSYVVIDNDYQGFGYPDPIDPMKVTVAHEFNHACQMAHDYYEDLWYMECSAVWSEDEVFDAINDYVFYISYFVTYPYMTLEWNDVTGARMYGSVIWNKFLSENYGQGIVPDIWDACENSSSPSIDVIASKLYSYTTTIKDEFREFAIWNWFTGTRDDGLHYEEGYLWPNPAVTATCNTYPIVGGAPIPAREPQHLACNYIRFNNSASGYDGLTITYDGPGIMTWDQHASVNVEMNTGDTAEYGEISLALPGTGEITIDDWDVTTRACLVVSNLSTLTDNMQYTFDADEVETAVPGEAQVFALRPASPNPFTESTSISYSVPSGGGLVDVTIYDVSGREIRTLVRDSMAGGEARAVWDGLDDSGRRVATGIYFARLNINGLTACGKLVVLK